MIEAHDLFGLGFDHIEIVIHPQSIIHSLVKLADSSVLAQLGWPDMRLPLLYTLSWPQRLPTPWRHRDRTCGAVDSHLRGGMTALGWRAAFSPMA